MRRKRVALSVAAWMSMAAALPGAEILRALDVGAGGTFVVPSQDAARTVSVATLDDPGIRGPRYGLMGEVRHRDVTGTGYLEMWTVLPQGRFYSRTLDGMGPMRALSGSSDWRRFVLPMSAATDAPPPRQILFNVVLPGGGSVELRSVRLVQWAADEDPLRVDGAWWGARTAGLLGGIAGSLMGCAGALASWLSARGRARGFVVGTLLAVGVLSAIALVAGAVAWARSQPYDVYYPLLLLGALGTALPLALLPSTKRRYRDLELRRMQAADLP